jgi:hypothetical protein
METIFIFSGIRSNRNLTPDVKALLRMAVVKYSHCLQSRAADFDLLPLMDGGAVVLCRI